VNSSGKIELADVRQGSALQSHSKELIAELHKWERYVCVALNVEDQLKDRPEDALTLEAVVGRVVRRQEARCRTMPFEADVAYGLHVRTARRIDANLA
jgi:hypothetical protein